MESLSLCSGRLFAHVQTSLSLVGDSLPPGMGCQQLDSKVRSTSRRSKFRPSSTVNSGSQVGLRMTIFHASSTFHMLSRGLASLRVEGEDLGDDPLSTLSWLASTRHLVYWYCGRLKCSRAPDPFGWSRGDGHGKRASRWCVRSLAWLHGDCSQISTRMMAPF